MFFFFLRVRIAPFKDIFSRQNCVLPDCTGYHLASQTVKKNTGVGVQYGVCVCSRACGSTQAEKEGVCQCIYTQWTYVRVLFPGSLLG